MLMATRGFGTVLLSFVLLGLGVGVAALFSGPEPVAQLGTMGFSLFAIVVFGAIFTLGIPYFIGMFTAVLFANRDAYLNS